MLYNYNNTNETMCLCKCVCGTEVIRKAYSLKKYSSSFTSCGCKRKELARYYQGKEINGKTYGRLTVIETLWNENPTKVRCICSCGSIRLYDKKSVQTGHTKSCGCYNIDRLKIMNEVDYTNYVSDYGIKILRKYKKNKKSQWLWECECGYCKTHFFEIPARIKNNHIKSCGCLKTSSREDMIENFLKDNNINYKKEYSFKELKNKYVLRFDFAIFSSINELICLVEYDGEQHFRPVNFGGISNELAEFNFKTTAYNDSLKNEFCKLNKIKLLRLPYYLSEEKIKEMITNIIYP